MKRIFTFCHLNCIAQRVIESEFGPMGITEYYASHPGKTVEICFPLKLSITWDRRYPPDFKDYSQFVVNLKYFSTVVIQMSFWSMVKNFAYCTSYSDIFYYYFKIFAVRDIMLDHIEHYVFVHLNMHFVIQVVMDINLRTKLNFILFKKLARKYQLLLYFCFLALN